MSAPTTPTSAAFAEAFRDAIRVGFNWDRFFAENWPIEVVTLKTQADLGRCFTPWYIGVNGDEVPYDAPDAVPMNLRDVPKAVTLLSAERRADIQDYVETFTEDGGVVRFRAPTYALPKGGHFILDRNHRLSALTMSSSLSFEVTLWNVRGPLESEGLLDLIHWLPPRAS